MIVDEEGARRWLRTQPGYDTRAEERLLKLIALLEAENRHQNLIARNSFPAIWTRHIADSAQLLAHVPRGTSTWLDLGSGAGFPGMIIAILSPLSTVTLVESRPLRARWLEALADQLQLENTRVKIAKLEAVPTFTVDAISARAFAPLDRLVEMAARFSTSETTWVLPKGRSARDELASLCGWDHSFHVEQSLTDAEAGIITGQLSGRTRKRG